MGVPGHGARPQPTQEEGRGPCCGLPQPKGVHLEPLPAAGPPALHGLHGNKDVPDQSSSSKKRMPCLSTCSKLAPVPRAFREATLQGQTLPGEEQTRAQLCNCRRGSGPLHTRLPLPGTLPRARGALPHLHRPSDNFSVRPFLNTPNIYRLPPTGLSVITQHPEQPGMELCSVNTCVRPLAKDSPISWLCGPGQATAPFEPISSSTKWGCPHLPSHRVTVIFTEIIITKKVHKHTQPRINLVSHKHRPILAK